MALEHDRELVALRHSLLASVNRTWTDHLPPRCAVNDCDAVLSSGEDAAGEPVG